MSLLLQRARASCPPSLLEEAAVSDGDQFYSRLASILDPQGMHSNLLDFGAEPG